MQPEFSRPTDIRPFLDKGDEIELTADASEREALAKRFGIPSVESFLVRLHGEKTGGGMYQLSGRIEARLTRTCVRTLEPMAEVIDDGFEVRLIERAIFDTMGEGHDEEPIDIEVMDGEVMDLGELSAQYLALLMNPYPRSGRAEGLPPLAEGDEPRGDAPTGPFAVLKQFKEKP